MGTFYYFLCYFVNVESWIDYFSPFGGKMLLKYNMHTEKKQMCSSVNMVKTSDQLSHEEMNHDQDTQTLWDS